MLINASQLSAADIEWGRMKARQMGVAPVVAPEHHERILVQSALLLASIRDLKRRLRIPVPDEGTMLS